MHARNRAVQMARGVRHAVALAAGENASLFMQAIAVMIADGTNKGRFADPWQRRVPDDRDALLLLAIVEQNSGPLCRELAAARLSFLLARQPVTHRAKACGRCPVDGGVHEFPPPQGSEACRKQQKMLKRRATPATDPSSKKEKPQCSSFRKASLSAISWPTPSPCSCSSYGSGCSS